MVDVKRSPTDEILARGDKLFREKFMISLQELLAMSRFNQLDTVLELGLGIQVFLTLVLALANNDIYLCIAMLKVAETVNPLLAYNKYMVYHMVEAFDIRSDIIRSALQYLEKLEQSQLIIISENVRAMLSHASDILGPGQSASATSTVKSLSAAAVILEEQVECEEAEEGSSGAPEIPEEQMECVQAEEGSSGATEIPEEQVEHVQAEEGSSGATEIPEEQVEHVQAEPKEGVEVSGMEEAVKNRDPAGDLDNPSEIMESMDLFVLGDDCKTDEGDGPLHICVRNKNVGGLKDLLDSGAEVNGRNKKGETCLMVAAKAGLRDVVDLLLQNGADANISDENGDTPLFAAVGTGDMVIIKKLLDEDVDIGHKNSQGLTVLYWSVKSSTRDTAMYLKEMGAILCPEDIWDAVRNCDGRVMELLKELGANFNIKNSNSETPLHLAVSENNELLVRCLVEAGSNINARTKKDETPLHLAVNRKNVSLVKNLAEAGADINEWDSNGETPLHLAVGGNNELLVKSLVEAGADSNGRNFKGWTPLHLAVTGNSEILVRCLVEAGADMNAKNPYNRTPLHLAVTENRELHVRCLLEAGADIEAKDSDNRTPLHWAVSGNSELLVRCLLEAGADINAKGPYNLTPLHFAVEYKNKFLVKYLVEAGADINAKASQDYPYYGWTPLGYARGYYRDIAPYLQSKGAK